MILPTKHLSPRHSLLGVGAVIVGRLDAPRTISSLWDAVRDDPDVRTFKRFVLALDLLFALGVLDYQEGLLQRGAS